MSFIVVQDQLYTSDGNATKVAHAPEDYVVIAGGYRFKTDTNDIPTFLTVMHNAPDGVPITPISTSWKVAIAASEAGTLYVWAACAPISDVST